MTEPEQYSYTNCRMKFPWLTQLPFQTFLWQLCFVLRT